MLKKYAKDIMFVILLMAVFAYCLMGMRSSHLQFKKHAQNVALLEKQVTTPITDESLRSVFSNYISCLAVDPRGPFPSPRELLCSAAAESKIQNKSMAVELFKEQSKMFQVSYTSLYEEWKKSRY